jgi:hypothetical protein
MNPEQAFLLVVVFVLVSVLLAVVLFLPVRTRGLGPAPAQLVSLRCSGGSGQACPR